MGMTIVIRGPQPYKVNVIALADHDCCAGFALVGMEMTVYITCSSPDPVEMPFFCSLGYSGYTGMFMDMPLIQGSHTVVGVNIENSC